MEGPRSIRSIFISPEIAIFDLAEPLEKTTLRPIAESLVSVATCDRSLSGGIGPSFTSLKRSEPKIATDRLSDRSQTDTTGRNPVPSLVSEPSSEIGLTCLGSVALLRSVSRYEIGTKTVWGEIPTLSLRSVADRQRSIASPKIGLS